MTEIQAAAIALLTRREHGAKELTNKLLKKGYSVEEVHTAVAVCQDLGLQSEQRYIEMIVRVRMQQGYGPERIRRELQQKQSDAELLEHILVLESIDWLDCAKKVLNKKYKSNTQLSWKIQQKQKQFLLYRGFSLQIITQLFKTHCEETDHEYN